MPDLIQLLPDNISNQIAAGEVIQRPASAVKELMENSIDAGATSIQLIVKNAGKTLIQVIDNGSGMSGTDARMCFEKHATSKIRHIDDLFAIRTMGFRGEAMASIAAIAQLELKTRQHDEELGTQIIIEGSEVLSQEPCQCPVGTSISVKNLFYNVPARRNFLKSDPVEMRHIIDEFQRLALAHPHIHFSLHHNDSELFHLRSGNLRQRIVGVFGDRYNERLVPLEEETDVVSISGFVGKPEHAKKTRGEQYIFVNNRFIKSGYLNHAVVSGFQDMLPKDHHPLYVLFLEIDPKRIDINVHPTKQEIKFEEERVIYQFINAAVRHGLGQYSVTPTIDFNQENNFSNLESIKQPVREAPATGFSFPKTEKQTQPQPVQSVTRLSKASAGWEQLYEVAKRAEPIPTPEESITLSSSEEKPREAQPPYQLHQRYIVSQIKSGFILIDQQAAHERILYERYLRMLDNNKGASQRSLFPQHLEFSFEDAELLREILPEINALGFDVQPFGQQTFVVNGFPSDIDTEEEQKVIEELIEQYKTNVRVVKLGKREGLARGLAQSACIHAGKRLSISEMSKLIDELFACENPYTLPSGKRTFIQMEFSELENRFNSK